MRKEDRNRASILIVLGLFSSLWVMINAGLLLYAALVYIVIGALSLFLYGQWDKFGRHGQLEGIDSNWIRDSFIGAIIAAIFIGLSSISPFIGAIGIPPVQSIAGNVGRFIIIVIAAPIMEEFLFREFILDFLENKLFRTSFFVAAVLTSILFALFHFVAYGANLAAANGSFISAGLAGMVFAYENRLTKSHIANIITHAIINFWIGFYVLSVIVG